MEIFKLIKPTLEYQKQAIDYINEFYNYKSKVYGSGGLERFIDDYQKWLEKLNLDEKQNITEEYVPSKTFFLIRKNDDKIVGMINLRLALNKYHRNSSGHIDYSIRPTERSRGYNKINLYLCLLECQRNGIDRVMLSSDSENLAAIKTNISLGGKLEKEYFDNENECNRQVYWIEVSKTILLQHDKYNMYIE